MIHFLSDLHLSPQTPGVTRRFLEYLAGSARNAQRLFVLGDLFEAWPGDDCIDDPEDGYPRKIVDALRQLSDSGVALSLMHGNRDFLLGEEFAARCGARLLPDPFILSLPSWQFVLSHGDALCADDTDYQNYRTQVRSPDWCKTFLARPLPERKAVAASLRQKSERSKQEKLRQGQYLMDLKPSAIDDFLRQHGYATFIHGHTHQPATHDHIVDGIHVERWVLADWHEEHGEALCYDGAQLQRLAL